MLQSRKPDMGLHSPRPPHPRRVHHFHRTRANTYLHRDHRFPRYSLCPVHSRLPPRKGHIPRHSPQLFHCDLKHRFGMSHSGKHHLIRYKIHWNSPCSLHKSGRRHMHRSPHRSLHRSPRHPAPRWYTDQSFPLPPMPQPRPLQTSPPTPSSYLICFAHLWPPNSSPQTLPRLAARQRRRDASSPAARTSPAFSRSTPLHVPTRTHRRTSRADPSPPRAAQSAT
mmetsp:Transcript_7776/g.13662  ORF Transcript_7776/g.13662 Transcript_7776/m.13662 type:complete len:224 (+) Transcript_7776:27508-28179(+)